jgi:hypothetical protein
MAVAKGGEIWMSASEPVWRQIRHWPANDYMQLFNNESPWRRAATVVNVFQLSKKFVLSASETDLTLVIDGLKQQGIALAVQGTGLLATRECGLGAEGHGPPHDMLQTAERLKRLGADLRYIVLDEPLHFGHEFDGSGSIRGCHAPIRALAEQAAAKVGEVMRIFPRVEVGGVEPFGTVTLDDNTWLADLGVWLQQYAEATGRPLAFLRADIVWQRPNWRNQLQAAVQMLRAVRIPLSVIYNGRPTSVSDEDWTDTALRAAEILECELHIEAPQVAFMTWMDRPRRMLPETDRGTLTNLILRYVQNRHCQS